MTFDLESGVRVTCDVATSVSILVFLGLYVLELGPMYVTDRQTDVRQTDIRQKHRLMPYGGGGIITIALLQLTVYEEQQLTTKESGMLEKKDKSPYYRKTFGYQKPLKVDNKSYIAVQYLSFNDNSLQSCLFLTMSDLEQSFKVTTNMDKFL